MQGDLHSTLADDFLPPLLEVPPTEATAEILEALRVWDRRARADRRRTTGTGRVWDRRCSAMRAPPSAKALTRPASCGTEPESPTDSAYIEGTLMPKEEWGVKRVCPTTGKRFYDLNKNPIVSPYTGDVVELDVSRGRLIAADAEGRSDRGCEDAGEDKKGEEKPDRISVDEAFGEVE